MTREISDIIKEWKDEAGVKGVVLVGKSYYNDGKLKICTDRPGMMIGFRGELVNKYTEKLNKVDKYIKEIEFVETDPWYIR